MILHRILHYLDLPFNCYRRNFQRPISAFLLNFCIEGKKPKRAGNQGPEEEPGEDKSVLFFFSIHIYILHKFGIDLIMIMSLIIIIILVN